MAVVNVSSFPRLDSLLLVQCQRWRRCSSSRSDDTTSFTSFSLRSPSSNFPSHKQLCCTIQRARTKSRAQRTICRTALQQLDGPRVAGEGAMQGLEWGADGRPFRIEELETIPKQRWNAAPVVNVADLRNEARCITVEAECSREIIELSDAYSYPGQQVQVKLNGGEVICLWASSPPFPSEANHNVLYKLKGDIPTGATKVRQFTMSVKSPLDLHVTRKDAPTLFDLKVGDMLELGLFLQTGMDLRPVMYINRFPTLLFFVTGNGIAIARSIVEARDGDTGSLNFHLREEVRLFYSAHTPSHVMYKDSCERWKNNKVKVRVTVDSPDHDWDGHVGTLSELWDADDLEYDPDSTAVVVCAEENQEEIDRLLADAGIPEDNIVKWDSNLSAIGL